MATAPKAAGIMDLPENEDMNQAPQLSPMESYDAVTTALNTASPDAAAQYEQTMNMSLPPELMEMSAEEISQLLQLFQYLQENPEEYPAAIADLIAEGAIDAGDLPPEYDEEVLATVTALLMQALRTKQGSMPQQPQGFAMGGIADAARIVANQGRGQDTMLAHITPEEAQLLRSRGGMGTINPMTGLREYGWLKKQVKRIKRAVKKVTKPIVKVAKKIVASPIGRIVATVALTTVLGPAAAGIGFSTAATAAAVSGGLSALSGGSLKDILTSSATAYFGAPGGPVSNFVGGLGISSAGAQAALASGISGTAAGLMQGQNLKDSLKGGLTQAAIGAGTAIGANYMSQPPGTRSLDTAIKNVFTPADALGDQIGGKVYGPSDKPFTVDDALSGKQPEVVNRSTPRLESARVTDAAGVMPQNPDVSQFKDWGAAFDGPKNLSSPGNGPAPVTTGGAFPSRAGIDAGAPVTNPTIGDTSVNADYSLASGRQIPVANSTTAAQVGQPAPQPPGMFDSVKRMGSGIMDIGQGNFEQGFNNLTGGAGDLFMPSGPTDTQIINSPEYAKLSEEIGGKAALERLSTQMSPGIMRTYGPAVAAGIGTLGLMGGFEPGEVPQSELEETLSGTPGMDLIRGNPNEYLVQNMRGIKYNPDGSFAGYQTPSQSPTTNRGDPYAGFYAPRSRPSFGSRGRPRFAAQGGIMDARGYASGGTVTRPAKEEDDEGYAQYYGGKNRIAYPMLPSNMDFISASLPYNDYYDMLALSNRGSQRPTRKTVIPEVTPYVPNYSSPTTVTPVKPQVAEPLSANEQMVMDMYAKAGRSGFGDERGTIDQGGFDYWVDELATGDISPDNFRAAFDTARNAQYATQNLGTPTPLLAARGGIAQLAQNGYPRRTGQISGPGTEKSDSIPAMLSDGEFVMTAKAVRGAGSGSRRAGAKKMYDLMHQLEQNAARG